MPERIEELDGNIVRVLYDEPLFLALGQIFTWLGRVVESALSREEVEFQNHRLDFDNLHSIQDLGPVFKLIEKGLFSVDLQRLFAITEEKDKEDGDDKMEESEEELDEGLFALIEYVDDSKLADRLRGHVIFCAAEQSLVRTLTNKSHQGQYRLRWYQGKISWVLQQLRES